MAWQPEVAAATHCSSWRAAPQEKGRERGGREKGGGGVWGCHKSGRVKPDMLHSIGMIASW